jgi:hypothetical protein
LDRFGTPSPGVRRVCVGGFSRAKMTPRRQPVEPVLRMPNDGGNSAAMVSPRRARRFLTTADQRHGFFPRSRRLRGGQTLPRAVPGWNGMGSRQEECPQEWGGPGHPSLKGHATALRRRANELRMGFRGEHVFWGFGGLRRGLRERQRHSARGGAEKSGGEIATGERFRAGLRPREESCPPRGRGRGQRGEAASRASSSDLADSADWHSQEWGACGRNGSSSSKAQSLAGEKAA